MITKINLKQARSHFEALLCSTGFVTGGEISIHLNPLNKDLRVGAHIYVHQSFIQQLMPCTRMSKPLIMFEVTYFGKLYVWRLSRDFSLHLQVISSRLMKVYICSSISVC